MKQIELFKERVEYYNFGITPPINIFESDTPFFVYEINQTIKVKLNEIVEKEKERQIEEPWLIFKILYFFVIFTYLFATFCFWYSTK